MPAIRSTLIVQASSFDPEYWLFTSPDTGTPIDLTAAGFVVSGDVASSAAGDGAVLLALSDTNFRRTATGRVYYEPSSATSAAWTFRRGWYQFYLTHPLGQTVRFSEGRFFVSPKI